MKNNKGITLVSLTMYIIGLMLLAIAITALTAFFYNNVLELKETADSLGEFEKFNVAFLKELRETQNEVTYIEDGRKVVFSNGVTFLYRNKGIYKNDVRICDNVEKCEISTQEQGKRLTINMYLQIGSDFAKTLQYTATKSDRYQEFTSTSSDE